MRLICKLSNIFFKHGKKKSSDQDIPDLEKYTMFKSLLDHPLIGLYIIQDNKFKFVNKGWCNISGYTPEDIIDKMVPIDMVIPEDKEKVSTNMIKRSSGKLPYVEYSFRKFRKDGSIITVNAIGNQVLFKGKPAIAGTLTDITKQTNTERELKESEEKYRKLIENSIAGVYIIQDDKLKYANKHFCDIFEYSTEEMTNRVTPNDLVYEKDKDLVRNNIQKRITGEKQSLEYEFRGLTKSGKIINLRVLGNRLTYKGKPAIMGMLIDTTKLKETENKLKESEHLFRLLLELAPYPITVIDDDMRHVIINDSFSKTFGLSKEESIGKNPTELNVVANEETMKFIDSEIKSKGKINNLEITLNIRDSETKEFLYSCLRFKLKNEYLRLNAFIDITERNKFKQELILHKENLERIVLQRTAELDKQNEELNIINSQLEEQKINLEKTLKNLHTAQEQLIQSEKMASLGVLAAGIAHEINNPLNFIHGGSLALENYLEDHPECNTKDATAFIDAIKEGVKRTADIVTSLNHYSRNNDQKKVPCNINNIINNCLSILKSQSSEKISIKKNLIKNLPNIIGNEGKLHQAFLNIIYNGIQAILPHEGMISIETRFDNKNIFIKIVDTGIGIPQEYINNVFDPFFTTKEPGQGTGLGLSITYNIITEHKGLVSINSKENEWTEINVVFPIKK